MDREAQPERMSSLPAEGETVVIQVPADADYLAVIRSASAHIATKLGCTLLEVADLRLAVDEACGLLLRDTLQNESAGGGQPAPDTDGATRAGSLVCRFILDEPALRVEISRQAPNTAAPQRDDFGWTILSALVDDIVWRVDGPVVHVEILKRRVAGG